MMGLLPESTPQFWGNVLIGKRVKVTSPVATLTGGLIFLTGEFVRLDRYQYRNYVVLDQNGKEVAVNIDHIFTMEEAT